MERLVVGLLTLGLLYSASWFIACAISMVTMAKCPHEKLSPLRDFAVIYTLFPLGLLSAGLLAVCIGADLLGKALGGSQHGD